MERKRLLLPGFISPELCEELVFVHKSCGVVGYRPHVFSTTLSHLVATNSAALIMPFIALRERVKEAVEEFFDCEFELFVEFTGLISWTTGANIGWHSDDNRDYLRQRHFSAVCYLNTYEQDFHGGLFHFQDGQPATVVPALGTVLIYSADATNIHSVDEVVDGERVTMALWFTRDQAHDEDKKLIDQLMNAMPLLRKEKDDSSDSLMNDLCGENYGIAPQPSQEKEESEGNADKDFTMTPMQFQSAPGDAILRDYFVPAPASTNMYWVTKSETVSSAPRNVGCETAYETITPNSNQEYDVRVKRLATLGFHCDYEPDSMLEKPLKLKYHHQCIAYEFANILHALQVVQFHEWRTCNSSSMCNKNQHEVMDIERTMVKPWEEYMRALSKDLLQMLPAWQNTGSIFTRQEEEMT
ncbi:hypothetical protein M758_3G181000 [Ceratodon purpureus]|nr:hypothetical protein M758_3G181000 [Ceratodon purpureus]